MVRAAGETPHAQHEHMGELKVYFNQVASTLYGFKVRPVTLQVYGFNTIHVWLQQRKNAGDARGSCAALLYAKLRGRMDLEIL